MSGWKTVKLADVVERAGTWNPSRSAPDQTLTYIDLGALDQDLKQIIGARELMGSEAPSRARQLVASGDVLVSTVRPNLNGVARVPQALDRATASTGFCVLRARSTVLDGGYLFNWVKAPGFVTDMVSKATGASYPAISDRIVLESRLPLPPLSEQQRIADVLDRLEAVRAKRRATLAALDALTHAVFLDIFGDPATNPKGWPSCLLGDLFGIARGGSPRPIDAYFTDDPDGINWVLISDASDSEKYITATKKRIRPEGASRSRRVQPGDFLLTNSMSFGRPYIMRTYGCIHDGWLVLSPKTDDIDADFFYELLGSRAMYAEFERRAAGATVKNLNIDLVRGVRVPIPPRSIQRDFARRAGAIEALRATQLASLNDLASLFASLQHRAFLGEL